MTDTKPTLEDLMDYVDRELNLADIEAQEIYTSLKELAALRLELARYGEAVRDGAVKEKPKEIDPNKWAFDRGLESY